MKRRVLCIPCPTKPTESPIPESLALSMLSMELSCLTDFPSLKDEPSITHSEPIATTYSGSSIHLSIQVERKDVDVHFKLYVNHKLAGKLVMQTDEYLSFIERFDITDIQDGARRMQDEYYAALGRGNARRKLH